MHEIRRRQPPAPLVLVLAALLVGACAQHAAIEEMRLSPALLCPCDGVRVEVVFRNARRVEVTLEPPGHTEGFSASARPEISVVPLTFLDVCEPAIASAVALLADPETVPATAAINVNVLLGPEAIPASSAPVCGPGCTITGYAPIRLAEGRFSDSMQLLEICNRSGRRVEITSADGRTAVLPFDGCSLEIAGAPLSGPWSVQAQPRIGLARREVCPDPACTIGELGPIPGVVAGEALALDFVVGCPTG